MTDPLAELRHMHAQTAQAQTELDIWRRTRDGYVESLYRTGDYTLMELARYAGLSKQRIQQIVSEGEGHNG